MPFLRALATPPGVLPAARAFRWPKGPGCLPGAFWPPLPSQNDPPFTCYISERRRALSKTSPGAHRASFGGLFGPSWADLRSPAAHFGPFRMPLHIFSTHMDPKIHTSKTPRKTYNMLTILAFSGFSLHLSWSSRAPLRALAAIFDPADALCGRPGSLSGPSSAVWARSGCVLSAVWGAP